MFDEYKKIVCPIDFSEISKEGLGKASKLASFAKGELFLVHVVTDPWSSVYDLESDQLADPMNAQKKAAEWLEELKGTCEKGHQCQCVVLHGEHIFREICDFAESIESDIIVLTTHGRTGVKRFVLGSVAENLIRYAKCSVLVIK